MKIRSPKPHINVIKKKTKSQNKCKSGVHCVKEARRMRLIKINKNIRTQDILIWSSKTKKRYWNTEVKKQGRVGSVYESFPLVRFSMFSLSVTFSKPLSYAYILRKVKIITPQPSKYHFIITGRSQRHYIDTTKSQDLPELVVDWAGSSL